MLSVAIAKVSEECGPVDLVITGMASLDAMTSMLPGALAAKAHMPLLGLARTLSVADGVATIERSVDGYTETLRARAARRRLRDRPDQRAALPGLRRDEGRPQETPRPVGY